MNSIKYALLTTVFIGSLLSGAARTIPVPVAAVTSQIDTVTGGFDKTATKEMWDILQIEPINRDALAKTLSTGRADTNKPNEYEYTPLNYVIANVHDKDAATMLAKLLMDHGANPLSRYTGRSTRLPIHSVILQDNIKLISLLLSKNPESQINVCDSDDCTPLMLFVSQIDDETESPTRTIDMLISKGANLFTKNRQGDDVLAVAIKKKEYLPYLAAHYPTLRYVYVLEGKMEEVVKLLKAKKYKFTERCAQRQKVLKAALLSSPEIAALPPGLLQLISSYVPY